MKEGMALKLKRVAVAAVILACLYGGAMLWGGLKLRAAYRGLREAGRPMTAGDVIPPSIKDAENAATLYGAAALCLRAQPAEGEWDNALTAIRNLAFSDPPSSNDTERVRQLNALLATDGAREALQLVTEGTKRSSCRYPVDYSRGTDSMVFPHFADLRALTVTVCAYAWRQAEQGDVEGAWRTTLAALRLANALQDDPMLISQLVRVAQAGIVCRHTQRLAGKLAPPVDRDGFDEALAAFESRASLVRAMDAERLLCGERMFSRPSWELMAFVADWGVCLHNRYGPPKSVLAAAGVLLAPLLAGGHAEYLLAMRSMTAFAERDVTLEDDQYESEITGRIPWYAIHARILVPSLALAKRRQVEMEANARVTRVGLWVLRRHADSMVWPGSLEAVGVDAAGRTDPFTGGELVYHTQGDGFVLYSLGPDMTDNGGTPRVECEDTGYDLAWRHSYAP